MIWLFVSAAASLPWVGVRAIELVSGVHLLRPEEQPYAIAVLAGLAILSSAYLLSVGAEVAEIDIPRSLALAFLALVAILPEYAVDMVFAWKGGRDPAFISFATANMTGANRLLIGMFWPVVVFVFWARHKRDRIELGSPFRLEVFFILLATALSFSIPAVRRIHLLHFVVLAGVFAWYAVRASRSQHEERELEGPASRIAARGALPRRLAVILMFGWAALGIVAAAEPFATSLVSTGASLLSGVLGRKEAEFLMVQWVAPLASEAPELVVASLFALKARPEAALGALVSSTVNQWTLLVGMLPLVYSLSHAYHGFGLTAYMPIDSRQVEEIFLTGAQSLMACVLIIDLDLRLRDAWLLGLLFVGSFLLPIEQVRWVFSTVYMAIAAGLLIGSRRRRAAAINVVRTRGADVSRA
jgi:cation:H+ antiporter